MDLVVESPCKVNLLLNVLGRRPDGFHELETLIQPVGLHDELEFSVGGDSIELSCNDPALPLDARNLVRRAAAAFFEKAPPVRGVSIHLEKRVPTAAGLGGGSANAALTLSSLNRLFDRPLDDSALGELAASLGSDVPFFLQSGPAIASGRGESIERLPSFPALESAWLLLIRPAFGISTPWAYKSLGGFPEAVSGQPGRAKQLADALREGSLREASGRFYNSLEAPAFQKYPILRMYKRFLLEQGAAAALMSGSGSTTFALFEAESDAARVLEVFCSRFGTSHWSAIVPASHSRPEAACCQD